MGLCTNVSVSSGCCCIRVKDEGRRTQGNSNQIMSTDRNCSLLLHFKISITWYLHRKIVTFICDHSALSVLRTKRHIPNPVPMWPSDRLIPTSYFFQNKILPKTHQFSIFFKIETIYVCFGCFMAKQHKVSIEYIHTLNELSFSNDYRHLSHAYSTGTCLWAWGAVLALIRKNPFHLVYFPIFYVWRSFTRYHQSRAKQQKGSWLCVEIVGKL